MTATRTLEQERPFASPNSLSATVISQEPFQNAAICGALRDFEFDDIREGTLSDFEERRSLRSADIVYFDLTGMRDFPLDRVHDLLATEKAFPAQLIVTTPQNLLYDAFGCFSSLEADILVDPTPLDHAMAIGLAAATIGKPNVRELSDEDRSTLVELTKRVSDIAQRLDRMVPADVTSPRKLRACRECQKTEKYQ